MSPAATPSTTSLQVSVEKRFSKGFTVSANYAYAKTIRLSLLQSISRISPDLGVNVINPYNVRAYRGVSDFNVPQRFVLNYLWELPSPKQGVMKALFGGWRTSAIWNWQSGFPLSMTSNDDRSLTGIANDLADLVKAPTYTSGSLGTRINQWFDTSAFASAKLDARNRRPQYSAGSRHFQH